MSADDLPPYDPWMEQLLEQERAIPPLAHDVERRLLSRLSASTAASAAATVAVGAKLSTLLAGTVGLVAGAAIGAAGYATLGPVKERVVTHVEVRERLVPTPIPTLDAGQPVQVSPRREGTPDAGTRSVSTRPRSTPKSKAAPQRDFDLAEENTLITRAQNALARGQADQALQATREHERLYTRGRFVEEREALAIQALARLGRAQEARARAQRFYRSYPSSLLTRLVQAAVKEETP